METLLNTVKALLQYTSFREEREFLNALKGLIESGSSQEFIEQWIRGVNSRTGIMSKEHNQFSSVNSRSSMLLKEFFK